jgi:hypothetical protein
MSKEIYALAATLGARVLHVGPGSATGDWLDRLREVLPAVLDAIDSGCLDEQEARIRLRAAAGWQVERGRRHAIEGVLSLEVWNR